MELNPLPSALADHHKLQNKQWIQWNGFSFLVSHLWATNKLIIPLLSSIILYSQFSMTGNLIYT